MLWLIGILFLRVLSLRILARLLWLIGILFLRVLPLGILARLLWLIGILLSVFARLSWRLFIVARGGHFFTALRIGVGDFLRDLVNQLVEFIPCKSQRIGFIS